jgi:hypothetical protein
VVLWQYICQQKEEARENEAARDGEGGKKENTDVRESWQIGQWKGRTTGGKTKKGSFLLGVVFTQLVDVT